MRERHRSQRGIAHARVVEMQQRVLSHRQNIVRAQPHHEIVRMLRVPQRLSISRFAGLEQQRVAAIRDGGGLQAQHRFEHKLSLGRASAAPTPCPSWWSTACRRRAGRFAVCRPGRPGPCTSGSTSLCAASASAWARPADSGWCPMPDSSGTSAGDKAPASWSASWPRTAAAHKMTAKIQRRFITPLPKNLKSGGESGRDQSRRTLERPIGRRRAAEFRARKVRRQPRPDPELPTAWRADRRCMSHRLHVTTALALRMLVAGRNAGLCQAVGDTLHARSEHRQ